MREPAPANREAQATTPKCRAQTLPKDDARLTLPALSAESCLVTWLLEAGPVGYAGSGEPVGMAWPTLAEWQRLTATPMTPWQARALVDLSQEYAAMLRRAVDPACPCPDWSPTADDAGSINRQVRAAFASLGV